MGVYTVNTPRERVENAVDKVLSALITLGERGSKVKAELTEDDIILIQSEISTTFNKTMISIRNPVDDTFKL